MNEPCCVAVGARSRASGRMANVTDSASRCAAGGCTAASGRKASRDVTAYDNPLRLTHGTKARGPTGCRTAMAPRRMLTEVSCRRLVVSTELCVKLWVSEFKLFEPNGYFTCHRV